MSDFQNIRKKKKKQHKALKKDFSDDGKGSAEGVMEAFVEGKVGIIQEFLVYGMLSVSQFHLYHLFTRNGTHHEAIGEFYEILKKELDGFAEQILGNVRVDSEDDFEVELCLGYDYDRCLDDIDDLNTYVSDLIGIFNDYENASIVDELKEIQEACNKLLYKMKLS